MSKSSQRFIRHVRRYQRLPKKFAVAFRQRPDLARKWRRLNRQTRHKILELVVGVELAHGRHRPLRQLVDLTLEAYKKAHGIP